MVHDHCFVEHAAARLGGAAGLVAQQTENTRQLGVDVSSGPGAMFVELARAGVLQPRNRLRPSADCSLVPRQASSSHTACLVAGVSALSLSATTGARGDDLAVVTDSVAGR